jgi:tRNA(His) 5'-end guanylyltransferase
MSSHGNRNGSRPDALGDRMKRYEVAMRMVLPPRLPVILRVDGKAFHTYTRGLERPFSAPLMGAMDAVARRLCEEIDGAQCAYVQSDEISILIHSYKRFTSQPWFGNQVQKVVSVAAGLASAEMTAQSLAIFGEVRPACFDARLMVLPEGDVVNCFIWRQQDAIRNSVQMLARSLFSHKECHKKSVAELKPMCASAGQPWEDLDTRKQRGRLLLKKKVDNGETQTHIVREDAPVVGVRRVQWMMVDPTPLFQEDRAVIEDLLQTEE